MSLPASIKEDLTRLATQDDKSFDLLTSAFCASKLLWPSANIDKYRQQVDRLCLQLKESYRQHLNDVPPLAAKTAALQEVMRDKQGFHGDEDAFDDLDHLNLFSVLEHKCATALTLSLLYLHCARTLGWSARALTFPGFSLIAIDKGAQRAILDPFHGCVELDAYTLRQMIKVLGGAEAELSPHFYDTLESRTLALHHFGAIKAHFLRCVQMSQAIEVLEACLCLEPESAAFWRETGLLQARIGRLDDAVFSLSEALKYTEDEQSRRHTQRILDDLIKRTR